MGVIEKAEIVVVDGQADEFEVVLSKVLPIIRAAEGCTEVTVGRGVEHPGTFLLLVEWTSLEAHTAFAQTPAFGEFAGPIKGFFAASPGTVHYRPLLL